MEQREGGLSSPNQIFSAGLRPVLSFLLSSFFPSFPPSLSLSLASSSPSNPLVVLMLADSSPSTFALSSFVWAPPSAWGGLPSEASGGGGIAIYGDW
ncbi:hypothetical protein RHMOL_Rhmol02G0290600 [Rhododendron molle]|uniref:Uncharacterized protein n=1 Tax=Rhododendron molle TaxID=49168 RepID=A0ACC0PX27_RHOML|nr:hypothetical protein RHMOL_Rhmol02G0290600 [Rhododendron molle]